MTAREITIDIETIPSQEGWVYEFVAADVKPPAQMKKAETIAAWYESEHANAVQDALAKTSFDGAMCHIICIGVQVDDDEPVTFYATKHIDERQMLIDFYKHIFSLGDYAHQFIGHNAAQFDMKLIRQRGIILGVNPPPVISRLNDDKWGDKIFDTMLRWDPKNFISLDKLCLALGIEGKGDFSGKDVYKAWQDGQEAKIRAYCADDVKKTRAVYKRMTFKK